MSLKVKSPSLRETITFTVQSANSPIDVLLIAWFEDIPTWLTAKLFMLILKKRVNQMMKNLLDQNFLDHMVGCNCEGGECQDEC